MRTQIFADKIEKRIKEIGLSKSDFANLMGVQPSIVTRWLSGSHNFTINTLFDIEDKIDVDFFLLDEKKDGSIENAHQGILYEAIKVEDGLPPYPQIVVVLIGGRIPIMAQLRPSENGPEWWTLGMDAAHRIEENKKCVTHWLKRKETESPKAEGVDGLTPAQTLAVNRIKELESDIKHLNDLLNSALKEKEEAEWGIDFGNHVRCRIKLEGKQLKVTAAVDGYGQAIRQVKVNKL